MTRIQKILLAVLLITLVIFVSILAGVGAYNKLAELKQQALADWQEFERIYQLRFNLIERFAQKTSQLSDAYQGTVENIFQQRLAFGAARTLEDRFQALINMEEKLAELERFVKADPTLSQNQEISKLLGQLLDTRPSVLEIQKRYSRRAAAYNRRVALPGYNLIADYFNFHLLPVLPVLWPKKD